jgi:hypothetical protein
VAGARKSFERALEIDPLYFPAAINLATPRPGRQETGRGAAKIRGYACEGPEEPAALLALADLRAQTGGTPDEIAMLLTKPLQGIPSQPAPYIALIRHYVVAGSQRRVSRLHSKR